MAIQQSPLFNDPIYNSATDPTLIWNHEEKQWWIIYTQRRPSNADIDVSWVHGTDLGIASSPDGHNFIYRGTIQNLAVENGHNTFWAPEIIFHEGDYHMYVSYITGVPTNWNRPRSVLHYTSKNLWDWNFESKLNLESDRVIDSCIVKTDNGFRMWYKDECDNSYSHYADSKDLYNWKHMGKAIDYKSHEGCNVFKLKNKWWYIGDFWSGQGYFKSDDLETWEYVGMILDKHGKRPLDNDIGRHADVVVQNDEAYVIYFTHPYLDDKGKMMPQSAVQIAKVTSDGEKLYCDRDEEFEFELLAPPML